MENQNDTEGFESNEMIEDGAVDGEMLESESDGIEQEMSADDGEDGGGEEDGSTETIAEPDDKSTEKIVEPAKAPSTPAYEAFLAAVQAQATALGLTSKEQKGFYQFLNPTTGHKLYVAKQSKSVTRVDTTLPTDLVGSISLPLEKPNGKITCHIEPSVEAVSLALETLASFDGKIPAPKRAAKAEGASASK